MKNIFLYLLIILSVFSSCGNGNQKNEEGRLVGEKKLARQLQGKRMSYNDFWGSSIIRCYDDNLFMTSQKKDSLIVVYRIREDSIEELLYFGLRGRGVYEFNRPLYCFAGHDLAMLNIQDGGFCDKIVTIDLEHLSETPTIDYGKWQIQDVSWLRGFRIGGGFIRLSECEYLFAGARYKDANLLTYINVNNHEEKALGYWIDDNVEIPNIPKQGVYNENARLFYNERKNRLLYLSGEGWYLDLMEYNDKCVKPVRVLYDRKPHYGNQDGLNYLIYMGTVRGMFVAVTDSCIYAMPRIAEDYDTGYKGYYMNHFDEIDRFDWDGKYIETLCLNVPCYSFAVSDNDDYLYAVTDDPETGETYVSRYTL